MLLIAVLTYILKAQQMVDGMKSTGFAINYRRGIVARGLPGSILDMICKIGGPQLYCYKTVLIISTVGYILYLFVIWQLGVRFIRAADGSGYAKAAVMFIAPLFIEMFITPENYGRTDMYLLMISVAAGYSVIKDRGMILCVICPVIGILIHEGYVFDYYLIILACLFYKFALAGRDGKKRYVIWGIVSILISLVVFIWVFALSKRFVPMSDEIFQGVVEDAKLLVPPGTDIHYTFLEAELLGKDLYETERDIMVGTRISAVLFCLCFIPLFIKGLDLMKAIYRNSVHKAAVIILCLAPVTFIPLFVRKIDYGRWIFAFIAYYVIMLFLTVIDGNETVKGAFAEQMKKISDTHWEPVFLTLYFMLFIPLRTYFINDLCERIFMFADAIAGLIN